MPASSSADARLKTAESCTTKAIALSSIAFDAGTQIRAAISESVVSDYADRMTDGHAFPPIVLFHDGNAYYLADGFHRFMAARRNDWREIDAEIHAGTKQDALWFALGANKANGQRLTEADKKHAIVMALTAWPEKGPELIAEQLGCTGQYVRDIRHRVQTSLNLPSKTRGKDGKMHPVAKPAAQHQKRTEIEEQIKAGVQSQEIVRELGVRPELVGAIRRELGIGADKSKAAVAQRRKDIRDMAERGYSTRQIAAAIGLDDDTVALTARKEGIVIHADRVIGKTKRHDSVRIVETIVGDAENLTEGVDLIDFDSLPRESFARWIDSLEASRKLLSSFIARLRKEQSRGEAA